jgi:hypothetical protein
MAQELRRDQPVRLPNPSAQPFVAALKTARLFAVVFFWITMVCILSYVVVFILTEWIGLYDAPLAPAAPVESKAPAEPKGPAAPAKDAAPAPSPGPGSTSWLGLLENAACGATTNGNPPTFFGMPATRRGETPPEKSPEGSTEETPEVGPSSSSPSPATVPAATTLREETSGKVIARPETPPTERRAPTLEEQRERAKKYYDFTLNLLKPLRVIGVLASFLLGATLFLYLQIALLGRLAGIRQLTSALFMLVLFLASVLPWDSIFDGFHVNAFYDFTKLTAAHASRLDGKDIEFWKEALFYIRFFFLPLISVFLLAWSGIRFASGYRESVVANE